MFIQDGGEGGQGTPVIGQGGSPTAVTPLQSAENSQPSAQQVQYTQSYCLVLSQPKSHIPMQHPNVIRMLVLQI